MSIVLPIYMRYALFAGIAMSVNLVSQAAELHLYRGPLSLTVAIMIGTGAGLLTKFVLDKYWIFFDLTTGALATGRKFFLYTATGVATTAIFWSFEYGFDALTPDGRWRYLGALIGLTIGYIAKYQLDRRFVFDRAAS